MGLEDDRFLFGAAKDLFPGMFAANFRGPGIFEAFGSSTLMGVLVVFTIMFVGFLFAHQKINMTMENPPFEDVCPTEHRNFPM